MLLITCPHCGPRSESEFRHAGEAHLVRPADPSTLDDQAWGEFLYHRQNPKGLHKERWRHIHGCARFFNMVRDTTSDTILVTYPSGTPTPPLPGESA